MTNFRTAKYDRTAGALGIDDPNKTTNEEGSSGAETAQIVVTFGDPSKAAENTAALNVGLATYGQIVVRGTGAEICWISRTLEPASYGGITVTGATLKLVAGANCNIIRSRNTQQSINTTNSVSIAAGVATILLPGHNLAPGTVVYLKGALGNTTLNGPKTIASVTGNFITVPVASSAALTNTDQQPLHVGRYNPVVGTSIVRTSNVVTVQEAGHRRNVGDHVYVDGLTGTNTFNGPQKITQVTTGSWQYANAGVNETAGGTAQVAGDTMMHIDVSGCDYNEAENEFSEMGAIPVILGNCSHTYVNLPLVIGGRSRSVHFFNASHINMPQCHSTGGKGTVQIESHCDVFHVGHISLYQGTDDILAWGVTANGGTFGATESASGEKGMGSLTVDLISGYSVTGAFKLFGNTGNNLGRVKIHDVVATGVIALGDGNPGASGASVTSLVIDNCDNIPILNQSQLQISSGLTFERLHIGRLRDNATSAATTGQLINMGATCARVTIGSLELPIARTSSTYGILVASPIGYLGIGEMLGTLGADSRVVLCNGASGIIDDLIVDNIRIVGTNAAHGPVFYEQGGGFIRRLHVNSGHLELCKGLHASNSAGQTHEIQVSNLTAQSVDWFLSSDVAGTFNVSLQNVALSSTTTNLLHYYVASSIVRFVGNNVRAPNGQWCLFTSTTSISIDCKECRIDLGANGGAPPSQLVPQAGDMLTNSNATGGGVYGRTVAGAWLKVI